MLAAERLQRGAGLERSGDRKLWREDIDRLPDGAVIVDFSAAWLVTGNRLLEFEFGGWGNPRPRPRGVEVEVLTPPTSVLAISHGLRTVLDASV
jgi:hypothetical protein